MTRSAGVIRYAAMANVSIHVQVVVVETQIVKQEIIYRYVHALRDTLEIHSLSVGDLIQVSKHNTNLSRWI